MSTKGFVGIGWNIGGWRWQKNFLAVAISESGTEDIEIMCANKMEKTENVLKEVMAFIAGVVACYNNHDVILAINRAKDISLTPIIQMLSQKLNFKHYDHHINNNLKGRIIMEVSLPQLSKELIMAIQKNLPEYSITKGERTAIICSFVPLNSTVRDLLI